MNIKEVKSVMGKWLLVEDDRVVDVCMGTVIANLIPGESTNIYIVGPPSSGKSEIIRSLGAFCRVQEVSSLTSNTLVSGWANQTNSKRHKPSLILKMKEAGKMIIALKDFTSIMTLRHESRNEILSQIREIADGKYSKTYGTGEEVSWEGKVGFIAGVTSVIDEFYSNNQILGERFLFYRIDNHIHPLVLAEHGQRMAGHESQMREEIENVVRDFLSQFDNTECNSVELSEKMAAKIRNLVCLVAGFRSGVSRDRYTGAYSYIPQVEAPPRLSKQFTQLAAGIALAKGMGEISDEVFRVIRKVGWDTIPAIRKKIILTVHRSGKPEIAAHEISNLAQMPIATVHQNLDDLMSLGCMVREERVRMKHLWSINPMYKSFIDEIGEDEIESITYKDEVKYEDYVVEG